MKNASKYKQQGSGHLVIAVIIVVGIIGTLGFVFWKNISRQALKPQSQISLVDGSQWQLFEDRYSPIAFKHPREWDVSITYSQRESIHIQALSNKGTENEKVMMEISYHKSYPITRPRGGAIGDSITPKCPYEVTDSVPSDCALVSNRVAGGYLYSGKGTADKKIVLWHGQNNGDRIDIHSYELDDSTLATVITSIINGPARNNKDLLISKNSLTFNEEASQKANAAIQKQAADSLNLEKCNEIKGITYRADPYDDSKVQILEEWQSLVECRNVVQAAITSHKAETLQGDDCSKVNRFSSLRRILSNVKILRVAGPTGIIVDTNLGEKTVAYVPYDMDSPFPPLVGTACDGGGSLNSLKDGEIISVYVAADNQNPTAYENETVVIQRITYH